MRSIIKESIIPRCMIFTSALALVNIIYLGTIDPYITYGVVFVQFHWLNQSRDIQNI
jgi:hypothetical protein